MVIINHSTLNPIIINGFVYSLWIYLAVPIFLLIQVFHSYKKNAPFPDLKKITCRIVKPYIYLQVLLFICGCIKYLMTGMSLGDWIEMFCKSGGVGPGSYYIWIYLQFAFLLPVLYPLVQKKYAYIYFVALSVLYEVVCSLFQIPEWLYRLLCFRYLYLFFLGYMWVKNGIVFNNKTFLLSILSAGLILYNRYIGIKCYPLFFNSEWLSDHWFMYFISWALIPWVFYMIYSKFKNSGFTHCIVVIGKKSYELFLFQMIVFCIPNVNSNGILCLFFCLSPILIFYISSKINDYGKS